MVRRLVAILMVMVFALLMGQVFAQGEMKDGLIGSWEGNLNTSDGSLRVVVHIKQTAGGSFQSALDRPERKEFNITSDVTVVQGQKLHFEVKKIGVSFDGVINSKGYLVGVWKQDGASLPLILERMSILSK